MKVGVVTSSFHGTDWSRVQSADWSSPPTPSDADVLDETIRLGRLAEPLGFDSIWVGEHFGTPYSMWPDAMQSMAFWAGATERVSLGSCVSVLPWHHPVTLASQAAMLDIMLDGREYTFGVGRGVSKTEYDELGIDRSDARGRFDETLAILRLGLSQERFSFEGEHFVIPDATIRPQPRDRDRVLKNMSAAASTPESMAICAEAGLGQLFVTGASMADMSAKVRTYNTIRHQRGYEPDQPKVLLWMYCTEEGDGEVSRAEQAYTAYGREAALHYGFADPTQFDGIKGYEMYAEMAKTMASSGGSASTGQGAAQSALAAQPIGSPDEVIRRIRELQEATSCREIMLVTQFGGIPYDRAERSMRLFAEKVLPVVQADDTPIHASCVPEGALSA